MGKTAVCGTESISVDERANLFTVGSLTVYEGEVISIDGTTGSVYLGTVPVIASPVTLISKVVWLHQVKKQLSS
ncbi:MAG: hypothetical protein WDO06_00535 [Actinomycetota bacterium]